jgi:ABC-type phosphate transport system substrate-binding protein
MTRRTVSVALATVVVASVTSLVVSAGPALADGTSAYDPGFTPSSADIVGVGSDTTEIVMHDLANYYNSHNTGPDVASFAADDDNPNTVDQIVLRSGHPAVNRPNGSGAGKAVLFGASNNPDVTFARSSSSLSSTESDASLVQAPFAVDGLELVVSKTVASHAPASITEAQLVGIYDGSITNWSSIGGSAGTIHPQIPQSGSGTRKFFEAQLQAANGGTPVTLAGSVHTTQEHSDVDIKNDADAVGPFSTARANTTAAATVKPLGGVLYKRAIYNVVRNGDRANSALKLNELFSKTGFLCSPEGRTVIHDAGFEQLADSDHDGVCGEWTTDATTNLRTSLDAANTVITPGAPAISGTAKVGFTLTASEGTWSPASVVKTRQWLRDGSPIAGATALTYVPVAADLGHKLSVKVTGTKAGFPTLDATSSETATVTAVVPGTFTAVAPARLLDTRDGTGTGGTTTPVPSGGSVSFDVAGKGGVPTIGAAGAVVLNVTVTSPTVGGFVTAYPTGATKPNASNLNFNAGQTIPNHVTVKLGTGGKVTLFNGSGGTVHLIADVAGWYGVGAGTENGTFTALDAPVRLLDTREPIGAPKAKIANGATLPFLVAGASGSGVPASGVSAGVLNVTVTNTAGGGFLSAFPNGTTPPTASNLNFNAGNTIPNAATVKLGGDGKVALFNGSNGPLDAIADIAGYFKSGVAEQSGAFTPLDPSRLLDTRNGTGAPTAKIPSGGSVTLDVANHGGVPASGAGAAVLNVTVTNTAGGGFVTAFPAGTTKPNASNLNFNPGTTIPNLVTVKLGTGGSAGKVTFYNGSGGTLDLIADVAGWYKN